MLMWQVMSAYAVFVKRWRENYVFLLLVLSADVAMDFN